VKEPLNLRNEFFKTFGSSHSRIRKLQKLKVKRKKKFLKLEFGIDFRKMLTNTVVALV